MAWQRGADGVDRWDGEPFPEVHVDQSSRPRRFTAHRVACAFAAQRAGRTGVRQHVQAVMTARGAVWEVTPA